MYGFYIILCLDFDVYCILYEPTSRPPVRKTRKKTKRNLKNINTAVVEKLFNIEIKKKNFETLRNCEFVAQSSLWKLLHH